MKVALDSLKEFDLLNNLQIIFVFGFPHNFNTLIIELFVSKSNIKHIREMQIHFREINPFDLWIWLEFITVPSPREKEYIEELFNSWFYMGKLGAFNAENLQVQETGLELSYMNYDCQGYDNSLLALMHNMSEFEYHGSWGRCWVDMGTSDAVALDILINSIQQLSSEYIAIKELYIGGINLDWPIEETHSHNSFTYDN